MPVHGLDHLLVTFAVGLIAVRIGGYALWTVPAAFSFLLLLGGIMNVSGLAVPFAEHAIFASIIVLGGLLAYRKQLPLLAGLAVVAFFAPDNGFAMQALPLNRGFIMSNTEVGISSGSIRRFLL